MGRTASEWRYLGNRPKEWDDQKIFEGMFVGTVLAIIFIVFFISRVVP